MIQELVQLAERVRKDEKDQKLVHDALTIERLDAFICIEADGRFLDIIPTEKKDAVVEDLVRTENKGRTSNVLARLILDNEKYVLGLPKGKRSSECLNDYLKKLYKYENVPAIKEVLNFYEKKKVQGLNVAQEEFKARVESKKLKTGTNFSFLVRRKGSKDTVVHSDPQLINEIKKLYEENEKKRKGDYSDLCSVCGSSDYRVRNLSTHGIINGILPRNPLGNYLVSYEGDAFSSYGLEGNDNSLICTHCAKAYVDALNWLLANGLPSKNEKGKDVFIYKNRKNISSDTAVVFWLRNKIDVEDISQLDEPDEGKIREMIESVNSGKASHVKNVNSDKFYAITLSGAAARIAIRDWIETTLTNLRENLVQWFKDIEIGEYRKDKGKIDNYYPRFWELVRTAKSKNTNNVQHGRIGAALWKCAILGTSPPIWILSAVLNRIRANQGKVDAEKVALLKLILNRKIKQQGGKKYMAKLDESHSNIAYTCGQLFAVLENIQYWALGSNLNAGIRERFFAFASTMPSTAFGRLIKLSQHHLSKIKSENYGLFVNLDKKLQELMCKVEGTKFPPVFSLEDQASFAIGYYHQQQENFEIKNKENSHA